MSQDIGEILNYTFWNNSIRDYLLSVLAVLVSIAVLKVIDIIIVGKLSKITDKSKIKVDDLLTNFIGTLSWPFYLFLSLYFAIKFITLPEIIARGISYISLVVFTYYIVKGIQEVIDFATKKVIDSKQKSDKKFNEAGARLINNVVKVVLWITAIILVLQNIGYNVTTLVAGLGLGGVAVAFAFQSILADMLAFFSIYFDKPFGIGDYISTPDETGTVTKIGIKSTRLKNINGEEVVIPNKQITEAKLVNMRELEDRRVTFQIGITHETPTNKVKKVNGIIEKIFSNLEDTKLSRVHLTSLGDFAIIFDIVYYINTRDYPKYLDTQQSINIAIKEEFESEGIELAYPTQKIHLQSQSSHP